MNNDRGENKDIGKARAVVLNQVGCSSGVANKIIGDTNNHKVTRATAGT